MKPDVAARLTAQESRKRGKLTSAVSDPTVLSLGLSPLKTNSSVPSKKAFDSSESLVASAQEPKTSVAGRTTLSWPYNVDILQNFNGPQELTVEELLQLILDKADSGRFRSCFHNFR
jgi:hypothetical protein